MVAPFFFLKAMISFKNGLDHLELVHSPLPLAKKGFDSEYAWFAPSDIAVFRRAS